MDGYKVEPGPSILESIWAELDASYAELMAADSEERDELKGRCAGLAAAIAIMRNPYDPDDDSIRDEVKQRYASR